MLILKELTLLLFPKFHITQLVGLNRLVTMREQLRRNIIENWLHHPEKVISRNCSINLVTRNSTHDNGTKTIREHSIHQAQTIVALAGSKDFLANCFLVHVFEPFSLSFFFSLSLSLFIISQKFFFFASSFFFLTYPRPSSMRPLRSSVPSSGSSRRMPLPRRGIIIKYHNHHG